MKKHTQLAELIMGSGLVGGTAKKQTPDIDSRPASAAATANNRPVLYQYGQSSQGSDPRAAAGYRSRGRPSSGSLATAVLGFEPPASMPNRPPAHLLASYGTPGTPQQHPASQPHAHHAWGRESDANQGGTDTGQASTHGANEQHQDEEASGGWVVEDVDGYSATYEGRGPPGRGSGSTDAASMPWTQSGPSHSGTGTLEQAQRMELAQPQLSRSMSHPSTSKRLQQPPQSQQHYSAAAEEAGRSHLPMLPQGSAVEQEAGASVHALPGPSHGGGPAEQPSPRPIPTRQQSQTSSTQQQQEVAELRRMVDDLRARNQQLDGALVALQQDMAALVANAAAAASQREVEHSSVMSKQLKQLKQAEEAASRSDIARRTAEKRAAAAETDLLAARKAMEAQTAEHVHVVDGLRTALEAARNTAELQKRGLEDALRAAREEAAGATRKANADVEGDKRAVLDQVEKLKQDVAKRTQMVLSLTGDLEAAGRARAAAEAEATALAVQVSQLQCDLQEAAARVSKAEDTTAAAAVNAAAAAAASAASAAAVALPPKPQAPVSRSLSATQHAVGSSTSSRRGSDSGSADPTRAVRALQTELAEARVQYAQRLGGLETSLAKAEAGARESAVGCDRLFQALVARTAAMLAGRVAGSAAAAGGSALPPRPGSAAGPGTAGSPARASPLVPRPQTPTARAAHAAAASGNPQLALLYQMNDKLASENAGLLAELARFTSGRHPLLRKAGMTTLTGQEDVGSAASGTATPMGGSTAAGGGPPLSAVAQLLRSSSFGSAPSTVGGAGGSAAAGVAGRISASGVAALPASSTGSSMGNAVGGAAATNPMFSAAKEALAAATREVLLCARKELLPAVMTEEGWGGGAGGGGSAHTRADAALTTADMNLMLRAQLVALQGEVLGLTADLAARTTEAEEKAAAADAAEAAARELRRDLATAQRSMGELADEARAARSWSYAGSNAGDSPADNAAASLEDRLAAAKDDAQRSRNAVAVAKRERGAKERELEGVRAQVSALEAAMREAKWDAQKQDEAVRRLRALLADARMLLGNAGIPFMEEDPGGPPGGSRPLSRSGSGRPGTASRASEDGSLFKSVEAREREKEVSRMRAELADVSHQLVSAKADAKKVAKVLAKAQADARQASDAADAAARTAQAAAAADVEAARGAAKRAERRAAESEAEVVDARRQVLELGAALEKLKLDADYLRARAARSKAVRPKLSLASALSLSIAPGT